MNVSEKEENATLMGIQERAIYGCLIYELEMRIKQCHTDLDENTCSHSIFEPCLDANKEKNICKNKLNKL